MTKISICMATYNGGKYIKQQLDSILQEVEGDYEIIISDDSSTDDTLTIVASYNNPRIIVLPNQKFRSPIFNFENALKQSDGDLIFLADQDDVWMPGRIQKVVSFFEDYDLVVSDCKVVNEDLGVLSESYFDTVKAKGGFVRNLTRTSPYIGCCMAFKKRILETALPFPKNIPMHDFWIAMIAELRFSVKFVPEPLVLYRRHSGNVSFTASGNTNPLSRKISFRVNTLVSLVRRLLR